MPWMHSSLWAADTSEQLQDLEFIWAREPNNWECISTSQNKWITSLVSGTRRFAGNSISVLHSPLAVAQVHMHCFFSQFKKKKKISIQSRFY